METVDYDKMAEGFRRESLTTKKDILDDIEFKLIAIKKLSETDNSHTAAFYTRTKELLIEFRKRIQKVILLEQLEEMWAYDIDIVETGITLQLIHADYVEFNEEGVMITVSVDERFNLIKVNSKLLTVDEYADMNGVTVETVRQWIRRGKLRTAIKRGGEWRIPELAEISKRGYVNGMYTWNEQLPDIPKEYAFLNGCNVACIDQDLDKKNLFHIKCWGLVDNKEVNKQSLDLETKDKEKFELFLIANQLVEAPTDFKLLFLERRA